MLIFLIYALTTIPLALMLIYKIQRMDQLRSQANSLKKSLDDMDEQAKLIVRLSECDDACQGLVRHILAPATR